MCYVKKKDISFGLQLQEKHRYFAVKEFCCLFLRRKIPRAQEKEMWSFTKMMHWSFKEEEIRINVAWK